MIHCYKSMVLPSCHCSQHFHCSILGHRRRYPFYFQRVGNRLPSRIKTQKFYCLIWNIACVVLWEYQSLRVRVSVQLFCNADEGNFHLLPSSSYYKSATFTMRRNGITTSQFLFSYVCLTLLPSILMSSHCSLRFCRILAWTFKGSVQMKSALWWQVSGVLGLWNGVSKLLGVI